MSSLPYLKLSVHDLVDFLLRAGDIDSRVYNQETMQMGSKLHAAYQEKQGNEYLAEYPLSGEIKADNGVVAVQGRADGIIVGGPFPIIDEIKSTVMKLDDFFAEQKEWHLGQALCYAYLFLKEHKSNEIGIQLTYLSQIHSDERASHSFRFTREEVEEKVVGYVHDYFEIMEERFRHIAVRDASIQGLPFPYYDFRPGQRELSKYVYGVNKRGGVFFAEAPTGIGKTISTLYPSVLSFKKGNVDRVFYLTAKNSGADAACDAIGDLYRAGFVGRDSTLFAKDKICFMPGHACNPDDCPFAKGYYTKLKAALAEATKEAVRFDYAFLSRFCRKKEICPFEFQLDLSLESDIIIADYNYFFDPMVKLERYFGEQADASTSVVLVDEAHNLVDRGRDMFSASLFSLEAEWAKKSLKGDKWKALRKNLSQLGELFEELLSPEESEADLVSVPFEFEKIIENLKKNEQKGTKTETTAMPDEFKRFSRECRKFSRILSTYYNEKTYRIYATREGDGIRLNLLCLDPSAELDASFRSVKGATLFSATLSPINYYMDAIVGRTEEPNLLLQSPFPKENLKMMIAPRVSVRYKDRDRSYAEVADYLKRFIEAKTGNYFLYFPSYEYMENIRPHLDFHGCNILVQGRKMKLDDRLEFLDAFSRNPQVTTVGLLILGGAFSEGIDLVDDRLIGVAIVGVGLPQIGHENNLIRDYRSGEGRNGFDYAYKFPGFNKVTQAVGRLIRSESDVGAALLIDDRYCHADYRPLVQRIWPKHEIVMNPQDVTSSLNSFYKKKEQ